MLELAASGAKVLQVRSVEIARNHDVKLHVRSSFSAADGTWIREEDDRMLEKALISGVTHTREETLYRVEGTTASQLFAALADASVNVDTIVQTGAGDRLLGARRRPRRRRARCSTGSASQWSARDDLGKVSVIGAGMKSHPGVAAKAFATLAEAGIEPEVVTTSPIKIACHVPHRRGRHGRRGAAPSLRARRAGGRAPACLGSASSAPPAPSAAWCVELLARARLRRRARCSRRRARPGRELDGRAVEEATPEALAAGDLDLCLFSVGSPREPRARPARRARRRGLRRQVRRPSGWRTASRSSCPR